MNDERCECCDLPTYSCGKSAEKAQRRREVPGSGFMIAQWGGRCGACGEWYESGDPIAPPLDPFGSWRGECCA